MNPKTALLNEQMKEHLCNALAQNVREDGRTLTEFRELEVE